MVRARVEVHSAVPIKQERTSYLLVGDNVHPNRKRREWRAVVVEPNGHPGLSMDVE